MLSVLVDGYCEVPVYIQGSLTRTDALKEHGQTCCRGYLSTVKYLSQVSRRITLASYTRLTFSRPWSSHESPSAPPRH